MSYPPAVEIKMNRLFSRLSEKERRAYAAVEAVKLGRGGTEYISALFRVDPKTIRQGMADLENQEDPAPNRTRKKGEVGKI